MPDIIGCCWPRASAPAPVWPDAAADLGSAGAERVAHRLQLENLARVRRIGAVSEKSIARQQAGSSDGQKRAVGDSADLSGACSGDKFVVSRAGEAYDAPACEPNRKSWL
jgi:hypothetical protein